MTARAKKLHSQNQTKAEKAYDSFNSLNGKHPWQLWVPEGYISYPVRKLDKGNVCYFNFQLAKEMGLIPSNHKNQINKALEQKILDTFSIRIINDYDQENNIKIAAGQMKKHPYMATRYLQLQHSNKKGETSGDGRSIWNGVVQNNGVTWDVSSRGTGVTALSPGAVDAKKPLKSGNTQFGYGCGMAEIDELIASSIMAEIMYNKDIETERVLAVIDLGGGLGIGVRAAQNLIRPAHFFIYLKQNNYDGLMRATDYFIQRQVNNGTWKLNLNSSKKYDFLLNKVCHDFAKFAATLEREYIFAWLDWDGDNVLANAGIIDYGSVRQFGIRHDQYRYDDVDRYSTTLNQQKSKARLIVQVFAQMIDYLKTEEKKPINNFKEHPVLQKFDSLFEQNIYTHFIYQLGFNDLESQKILRYYKKDLINLYNCALYFERVKQKKTHKTPDGINKPAMYNVRNLFKEYPKALLNNKTELSDFVLSDDEFYELIKTEYSKNHSNSLFSKNAKEFQNIYKRLILKSSHKPKTILKDICSRSEVINRSDRMTGNALIYVVSEILSSKKKGLSNNEIQKIIDHAISQQCAPSDKKSPSPQTRGTSKKVVKSILTLIEGHKNEI